MYISTYAYIYTHAHVFLVLSAHLITLGSIFQRVADDISRRRLPIRIVLLLFGTSVVVDAERRGLLGLYQFNSSHKYEGASWCSD